MFGKRQRRPEDDEPLVPHGLIWQATDDAAAAEKPQTEVENPDPTVAPLKVASPPSRAAPPASPVQLSAPKADSTGEKSGFWQKLPKLRAKKPQEGAPANSPEASHPAAVTVNRMPWRRLYARWAADLLKRQGIWAREARRRVIVVAHDVSNRVRARSPHLNAARTGAAVKQVLPRPETVQAIGRDSRLWTSFAMAGLSALLVLGFVSAVHHYAAKALPSNTFHNASAAACVPTEAASQASPQVAHRIQAAHSQNRTASIPAKRANTSRVARPRRPRRFQDDDYVAPDTFVSYDNRRGSSH